MRKIIAIFLVLLLTFSLVSCGTRGKRRSSSKANKSDKIVIGAAFTGVDIGFWGSVWQGFEDKAKELDIEFIQVVADGDADKQNNQIKDLIAQSVDAIAIAPADGFVVASAVKMAQAAGIPCVMVNRPLQSDEVVADMSVLSDNRAMAYEQLTWLAEHARKEGVAYNILLFIGSLSDENAVQRREGHYQAIEENSDVLRLVVDVPTDWKTELVLLGVQNSMRTYDNINCIVFPSDGQVIPIRSALEQISCWTEVGAPNHITLCSFDGDSRIMEVYETNNITCTAVQDAYGQGARSLDYAVRLAKGEKFDDKVDLDYGIQLNYLNYHELKEDMWGYIAYKSLQDPN